MPSAKTKFKIYFLLGLHEGHAEMHAEYTWGHVQRCTRERERGAHVRAGMQGSWGAVVVRSSQWAGSGREWKPSRGRHPQWYEWTRARMHTEKNAGVHTRLKLSHNFM